MVLPFLQNTTDTIFVDQMGHLIMNILVEDLCLESYRRKRIVFNFNWVPRIS